ncbi:MAG: hypothetical protein ACOH2T_18930 [Pseudomonas sp.]
MSNPFANLDTTGVEDAKDFLGGGGVLDSDVYPGTIKMAFTGVSEKGAKFLALQFVSDAGQNFRETIYVTNRSGEIFWERNGKKNPLPGYTTANDLALLATGVGLGDQEIEDKVVSLYNFDAKEEVPTKVPVVTSLLGKRIKLGILRQLEDKNVKNDAGDYVPSGETRDTNTIDKVFHDESDRTVSEVVAKKTEAEFQGKWLEKNQGKVINKVKGAAAGAAGGSVKSGAPGAAAAKAAPAKSLFG